MNRITRMVISAGLLAIPFVSLGGCGLGSSPDTTSSTATGEVRGKVTLNGKAISRAEVKFNPSNINRKDAPTVNAPIRDDGTYQVTTLVGQNQVSLTGPGVSQSPQLSYYAKTIDVKPGVNEFDITFP